MSLQSRLADLIAAIGADVKDLLTTKAGLEGAEFTGEVSSPLIHTTNIIVDGGSPGVGKVLTSDADGVGTWQPAPSGSESGSGGREMLTAPITYYVRTDGDDTNDGLADTAGGAFQTIQKALDAAGELDTVIYSVTVKVGDGTYLEDLRPRALVGAGFIFIVGNTANPADVVVASTSSTHLFDVAGITTRTYLGGFTFQKNSGSGMLINVGAGAWLNINGPMRFGATPTGHINVYDGGILWVYSGYEVFGSSALHLQANRSGVVHVFNNITITMSGSPHFSTAFAVSQVLGIVGLYQVSISGSATGKRYYVLNLGIVNVYSAGTTFLPGTVAGTVSTGGQYV